MQTVFTAAIVFFSIGYVLRMWVPVLRGKGRVTAAMATSRSSTCAACGSCDSCG